MPNILTDTTIQEYFDAAFDIKDVKQLKKHLDKIYASHIDDAVYVSSKFSDMLRETKWWVDDDEFVIIESKINYSGNFKSYEERQVFITKYVNNKIEQELEDRRELEKYKGIKYLSQLISKHHDSNKNKKYRQYNRSRIYKIECVITDILTSSISSSSSAILELNDDDLKVYTRLYFNTDPLKKNDEDKLIINLKAEPISNLKKNEVRNILDQHYYNSTQQTNFESFQRIERKKWLHILNEKGQVLRAFEKTISTYYEVCRETKTKLNQATGKINTFHIAQSYFSKLSSLAEKLNDCHQNPFLTNTTPSEFASFLTSTNYFTAPEIYFNWETTLVVHIMELIRKKIPNSRLSGSEIGKSRKAQIPQEKSPSKRIDFISQKHKLLTSTNYRQAKRSFQRNQKSTSNVENYLTPIVVQIIDQIFS